VDLAQYEQLQPRCEVEWQGQTVLYATPNRATRWRAESLFSKEPVTIDWMSRLGAAAVLADVGANVGMYSIWAAKVGGARVFSFEPEAQNYALLNRNIALNGLGDRVTAFCLGLSDRSGYSELHLSGLVAGASNHSVGERVNFRLEPMQPAFSQGCVTATLDSLVAAGALPQPTHLKVDVDGLEYKVAAGAARTLRDERLRSVLIELNPSLEQHRALVTELEGLGFRWSREQVAAATRADGPFKGMAEYVFNR
jgi:FkbM family methyltransferase